MYTSLAETSKILFPILHIKTGLATKILTWELKVNENLELKSYLTSKAKFGKYFTAERILGKQVNELIRDQRFNNLLSAKGKTMWSKFAKVVQGFLGKKRHPNYKKLVTDLMKAFHRNGIKMSHKIHVLDSHINLFPSNNSDYSDESGERFHQEIARSLKDYSGKSLVAMVGNYCWRLMRSGKQSKKDRKSKKKVHF